jgi:hypothetical protein
MGLCPMTVTSLTVLTVLTVLTRPPPLEVCVVAF